MLTLDFTWYRDRKGYRLIPAKPIPLRSGKSLLDVPPASPARIVRNGGELESYRPLERFSDLLVEEFLKIKTEKDVLNFIQRFGPLTTLREKGDVVPAVIDEAKEMSKTIAGEVVARQLNKLNVKIVSGLQLKISPACLLDAIWLQLVQGRDELRMCENCSKVFSGKRKDARFCSDHCRTEWNNRQRPSKGNR